MKKKLNTLSIVTYVLVVVLLLGAAAIAGCYFTNAGGFADLLEEKYLIITLVCVIGVCAIYCWVIGIIYSSYRNKSDLKAAEVIGEDIQEAYNFAMLGLVITDENDVILWTNDLFRERHIDIIEENILEWQPRLAELKDNNSIDNTSKIMINNRNYEVKYLPEAGLWIFKDNTDYEQIYTYSRQQAPVIGILSIDNFDEVVKGEEDYNDTISKVKNIIFDYAKNFGILLRRFKDSNYSMLCTNESFQKMKEDHFSVIDKVREASEGEHIPLTLSIGLATSFPDVVKLNELATAALSIAMSRGGDQVVVSVYGSEMEFYGGKTEAQEKRNRVRIRVLADSLINLISNASNVLIMGHTQLDMDSLGSCLGIKAICDRCDVPSNLVIDLKATEGKTRSAITSCFNKQELEKLIVSSKAAEGLVESNTLIVVVDVHTPNMVMAPNLLEKSGRIVVIDHHRRGEEYIESLVFDYIDPSASSATEIITELIRYASISPRIDVSPTYATIMLSGIFLDSDFYKSNNTGIRTFESSTILKEFGANNALADDLLKDDYEEYKETTSLLSNVKTLNLGVVYSIADKNTYYDNVAISKAATTCLSMKGVHASFVIGRISSKEIKLSARSDGLINVSLICEKMGGGGHFTMAAATFYKSDIEEVEKLLIETVDKYLNDAMSDAQNVHKV